MTVVPIAKERSNDCADDTIQSQLALAPSGGKISQKRFVSASYGQLQNFELNKSKGSRRVRRLTLAIINSQLPLCKVSFRTEQDVPTRLAMRLNSAPEVR